MEDLARYTRKTHIAIHSRYFSSLVIGSVALVGLVFTLGVAVGSRQAKESRQCPEPDPLSRLDLRSNEPSPPTMSGKVDLSFYNKLVKEEDNVPTPASLMQLKHADGEPSQEKTKKKVISMGTPRADIREEPIPDKVDNDDPGYYSLQVGSFQSKKEANDMIRKLGRAGHQAYVVSVQMPERGGLWYRVRVGPFQSKKEAWDYKKQFEETERLPAFVVKRRANG